MWCYTEIWNCFGLKQVFACKETSYAKVSNLYKWCEYKL